MNKSILKRLIATLMIVLLMSGVIACQNNTANKTDSPATTTTPAADITDTIEATPTKGADKSAAPTFTSTGEAKVTVDGTKFMVGGNELWINGVNTPWNNWNDFGGMNFNPIFWEDHFAKLEEAGVNASRVWINCNGMVGVQLNEDGSFKLVSPKQWQDLDKLFAIAEKHHIYIMATLLSFDHFKETNDAYQNWRNMITSSDNIDSFVEGYVIPFVQRYDSCDYLWSIDLANEPDWINENKECGQIGWENISNYFARASAGIHENSDVLVTVGLGIVKYNSDRYEGNKVSDEYMSSLSGNENSYLDFYSTHYYYWEKPWFGYPFDKSPTDFGLDGTRPCVIGETASLDESGQTITEKYEGAYHNGWNGVMAWTSNGVDGCGGFDDVLPAITRIKELAPDLIHPLD